MFRTSRRDPRRTRSPRAAVAVAAFVLIYFTARASAHQLSVIRGLAEISPTRLVMSLQAPAEDLRHHPAISSNDAAFSEDWFREQAARYGERLIRRLRVYGPDGKSSIGTLTSVAYPDPSSLGTDWTQRRSLSITFALEYEFSSPPAWLTFRWLADVMDYGLRSQIALLVRGPGDSLGRTIRLTSGGNTETLLFDWNPPDRTPLGVGHDETGLIRHAGVEPRCPDPFKSVCIVAGGLDSDLVLHVRLPFTILETWTPIPRKDDDFLDADEQAVACEAVARLLSTRVVAHRAGFPARFQVTEQGLLMPTESTPHPAGFHPQLSVWSTRLAASLRLNPNPRNAQTISRSTPPTQAWLWASGQRFQPIHLDWDLFNNGVLDAHLTASNGHGWTEHLLTTYAPRVTLLRIGSDVVLPPITRAPLP